MISRGIKTLIVTAAAMLLAACFTVQQPPAAQQPPAPQAGRVPQPSAAACVKEGESCSARGSECCAGLICVGSRGSICVTRF